jgi:hypothetical protein
METNQPEWTAREALTQLEWAVGVELWTIPPYLTAFYSIEDPRSPAGKRFAGGIRRIFVEEMLHLEIAGNILNALGGRPKLTGASAPRYDAAAPHLRWTNDERWRDVRLGAATPRQIQLFVDIERPDPAPYPKTPQAHYDSIGQFYDALMHGLRVLAERGSIELDPRRMVEAFTLFEGPQSYLSGHEVSVASLDAALDEMQVIISEGEGTGTLGCPPGDLDLDGKLPHYCVFKKLLESSPWPAVYDLAAPPEGQPFPDPNVEALAALSDGCFSFLLDSLEGMFSGRVLDVSAVPVMWNMVSATMGTLVKQTYRLDGRVVHALPRWRYAPGATPAALQTMLRAVQPTDKVALAKAGLQLPFDV